MSGRAGRLAQGQRFLPSDFEVPELLETNRFRIRPLTIHDLIKDYDAVMTSREHRWGQFGQAWGWPREDLTLEQDLIDLAWHQKEAQRRSSFTYAVMGPEERVQLGCVYLVPSQKQGFELPGLAGNCPGTSTTRCPTSDRRARGACRPSRHLDESEADHKEAAMDSQAAAGRWAATWTAAWRAHDVEAVVALYAQDCVHRSTPFRPPHRGRQAVRDYVTQAFADEQRIDEVRFDTPIVQGDRACVEYWATFLDEHGTAMTLAGCAMARFDAGGLITEARDYWHLGEGHQPPPEWDR